MSGKAYMVCNACAFDNAFGEDDHIYVIGEVENEGDVANLYTNHVKSFGDLCRLKATIVMKNTMEAEFIKETWHGPDDPIIEEYLAEGYGFLPEYHAIANRIWKQEHINV